jgi:hypothetical protein
MSVYANGNEISGKATPNKSIAAMPDVCMSPPSPPAGPVPIPYPNTAMSSDTDGGSKKVKIKGKPAGLKNASTYKQSNGNQPATNSFGAGVVTHKLTGASKHAAWSFNVKIEGQNAIRFGDLTTHNHANPGNGGVTTNIAGMSIANPDDADCEALEQCNTDTRADMQKPEHPKAIQEAGSGNVTVTHAKFTSSSGTSMILRGCSRQVVSEYDNSFTQGLTSEQKAANASGKSVKSQGCGGHVYKRGFFMPHCSHTEARFVEDLFARGIAEGGTLLMSINWPGGPSKGLSKKSPCSDCNKLLCAVSECMTILICDEDDEPQPPECNN